MTFAMERRAFVGMFASALVGAPRIGAAQPAAPPAGKVYRVGVLSYLTQDVLQGALTTFRHALVPLGYVEGRNLALEVRTAAGRLETLPELGVDLVRSRVDVILAIAPLSIRAARQATSTVPIVMALGDPATFESLARPGGNVTGVTALAAELAGKQVELIKEVLPRASRVAVLRNPDQPVHAAKLRQAEAVARALGVRLIVVDARTADDFDAAFLVVAGERAEGLIVFADGVYRGQRVRLVEIASRLRLPAVYGSEGFAQAGGLIAYVPDPEETYRRAASFVARILKGASPATLPVEQPTRFHLLVNRRTAAAIGLTLPPALMLRADQVLD
jgi:putative tryptophan/tyrosine transport system substrate-binding protein